MESCFDCFTSLASVYRWFEFTILRWITRTWRTCTAARCVWWCLCCNKWLCWIALIVIAIVSVVIWLVVEIILIVVCLLISIWCLICNLICFLGCFGNQRCTENCVSQGPCGIAQTVEIEWDYPPVGTGTGGTGSTPGTGIGTGIGAGTGTGTTTQPDSFSMQPQVKITRIDELEELVQWKRLFSLPSPVNLEFPNVSQEQSRHLQSKVDRYLTACGCHEGKIGILVASVLFVIHLLAYPASHHPSGWSEVGLGLSVVFLGALVGKVFGLLRARILLRKSVHEFRRSLQPA